MYFTPKGGVGVSASVESTARKPGLCSTSVSDENFGWKMMSSMRAGGKWWISWIWVLGGNLMNMSAGGKSHLLTWNLGCFDIAFQFHKLVSTLKSIARYRGTGAYHIVVVPVSRHMSICAIFEAPTITHSNQFIIGSFLLSRKSSLLTRKH